MEFGQEAELVKGKGTWNDVPGRKEKQTDDYVFAYHVFPFSFVAFYGTEVSQNSFFSNDGLAQD